MRTASLHDFYYFKQLIFYVLLPDCHWVVDPEQFYHDCLYDMCSCEFKVFVLHLKRHPQIYGNILFLLRFLNVFVPSFRATQLNVPYGILKLIGDQTSENVEFIVQVDKNIKFAAIPVPEHALTSPLIPNVKFNVQKDATVLKDKLLTTMESAFPLDSVNVSSMD